MSAVHVHEDHAHDHDHERLHRRALVQAWLKTGILVGLGLYFGWTILSDNLPNYINARFVWLAYVATAIFLLLGLTSAWALLRKQGDSPGHDHDHNHGVSWAVLAVVAIPLVLGVLVPSRPLGAEAVSGNISISSAAAAAEMTTFNIPPLQRNILDWLRVFNSVTDFNEISGQPADLIGFVYREPTFAEDKFMVARYSVSCCVADASALGVPTQWDAAAELPQGQWVRVQGEFEVGSFRDDMLPVLFASSIELIEQPAHPYLYP